MTARAAMPCRMAFHSDLERHLQTICAANSAALRRDAPRSAQASPANGICSARGCMGALNMRRNQAEFPVHLPHYLRNSSLSIERLASSVFTSIAKLNFR